MELGAATRPRSPARGRRSPPGRRGPRSRQAVAISLRLRRIALITAIVVLIPVAFSFFITMSQPSNSSFGVRTVEWLRDHGAAGLVAKIESTYYALTAPSKGGPTLHALPRVGYGSAAAASRAREAQGATTASGQSTSAAYRPPRVTPLIHPALEGEGVWRATRPGFESSPPVLITTLRNQPEYPRVVAGLAWIDTNRTTVTLNPGRQEPSVSIPRGAMDLPKEKRGKLLASFNSGFKLSDSRGGLALNGHTYATMRNGQATLVGYSDGRVDVVEWSGGPIAPTSVAFARQNLPLIVDNGRPNPNLNSGAEWGATVGGAILVWRSGIGVDRYGNLIYAAGDNQTVPSLAATLIHAGAVRAMELDINSYWVSFITYGAPEAGNPTNLLPDMNRSASRYLEPDDRDFFAVYAR
jgi:hypothetical protein